MVLDKFSIMNVGNSIGLWHHGCYTQTSTSCGYNNNAHSALESPVNLSATSGGSKIQTRLEFDLGAHHGIISALSCPIIMVLHGWIFLLVPVLHLLIATPDQGQSQELVTLFQTALQSPINQEAL